MSMKKNSHFGQRVSRKLKQSLHTREWLAEELGISLPTLYRWLRMPEWPKEQAAAQAAQLLGIDMRDTSLLPATGGIPLVQQAAVAGLPGGQLEGEILENAPQLFIPGMPGGADRIAITVDGDSMIPTLLHGDILLCERIRDTLSIRIDTIHLVVTREGALVKRLRVLADRLELRSDNPQLAPYTLPLADVLQLWVVMRRITEDIDGRLGKLAVLDLP
jgi:transcriptional regulator with XRE-family HTH domain